MFARVGVPQIPSHSPKESHPEILLNFATSEGRAINDRPGTFCHPEPASGASHVAPAEPRGEASKRVSARCVRQGPRAASFRSSMCWDWLKERKHHGRKNGGREILHFVQDDNTCR
ncbi:MAG: hypothetical protein ACREBW_08725, partial [Candidatus Micrarchaeaceae archaeon]